MRSGILSMVMLALAMASVAFADTIRGVNIDFVTIGNPGNLGDTRPEANPYGCGFVDYVYQIGKYEITNAQWDAFVAVAGAPTGNLGGAYDVSSYWTDVNVPVNSVSWYEAAQFCNYLTSGDKSLGAYLFNGDNTNPGDFLGIDRDSAISAYSTVYVIPTEDEWYKAAYYTGNGYSTYANGLDAIPTPDNGWNYTGGSYSSPWDIGTGTMEQNGTFDMMGNVWEWNEALIGSNSYRGLRGGSYFHYDGFLASFYPYSNIPTADHLDMGLRVASIPEPCTLALLGLGGLLLKSRSTSGRGQPKKAIT